MPFVAIGSKPSISGGAPPGGSSSVGSASMVSNVSSPFQMTRSTPVEIVVVSVSVLFVSSGSKIALFGSTVTVFVIEPTFGGATSLNVSVSVSAAGSRRRCR